jgi:hypothetical protein
MEEWHRWFAWRPVISLEDDRIFWLCFVERRQVKIPVYWMFSKHAISHRKEWRYRRRRP